MTDSVIVPLAHVGAADVPLVGAKAANLGAMMRAGLPVPRGFCLSTAAFQRHVTALGAASVLAEVSDAASDEALQRVADTMQALLVSVPMPADLADEILLAWERLLDRTACAVRSSATAEDLPNASFAGQLDSRLNVRDGEALLHAIRQCWASLFSSRAVAYRVHHGLNHGRVLMAVVVQELVSADAAGVLFTVNPLSGRADEILVEASYGLGEAVVSGRVTPDRFVLDKASLRISERTLGNKVLALVPAANGGVCERPLAAGMANAVAVEDGVIHRIAELGMRAEHLFGGPQDVEWAVAGGEVFVLQSRPVTMPVPPVAADDRQVWTNMNVGEILPDVVSPLTRSLLEQTSMRVLDALIATLGFDLHEAPLFGFIAGRIYFNLNTCVALIRSLPGGRDADGTDLFGGMHDGVDAAVVAILEDNLPPVRLSRLQLLQQIPKIVVWGLRHLSIQKSARAQATFVRQLDAYRIPDPAQQDEAWLVAQLNACIDLFRTGLLTVGSYAVVGLSFFQTLRRLCERWLPDEPNAANDLLTGLGGMASADAGLDMWRLAAVAHQQPDIEGVLLGSESFAAVRLRLTGRESGAAFLARWDEFMARHGHHARGEVELMNARWADDPDYVLGQVQSYLRNFGSKDPVATHRARAAVRVQRAEVFQRRLGNPARRALFKFCLRRAQHGVVYRENVKNEAVRLIALMRRIALELGRRWVERDRLVQAEDIFFLRLDELQGVTDAGGQGSFDTTPEAMRRGDLRTMLEQRRASFEQDQSLTPPGVVVGRFNSGAVAPPLECASLERLTGMGVSPGVATGVARVILRADTDERILPGEILVAPFTDPGWTPYFQLAAGLVTDLGGLLSHGSIVAREYGLPAVVNVGHATRLIRTGDRLEVDGRRGVVRILR